MGPQVIMLFLAASGIGQLVGPAYLSFDICALGLCIFSGIAFFTYPFSFFLACISYLGMGFFGRGFFACALLYLNDIGGDRFRAWSLIVIFAIWGISSLLSAFEEIVHIPSWIWFYGLIFVPNIICCRFLLLFWKPSPYYLYCRSTYILI